MMLKLLTLSFCILCVSCSEKTQESTASSTPEILESPQTQLTKNYFQEGEDISIHIKGIPFDEATEINGTYAIGLSKSIKMPFLKEPIIITNLNCEELARKIETLYIDNHIYNFPKVTVSKRQLTGCIHKVQKFITVSGDLPRPGPMNYKPGITAIEALEAAGYVLTEEPAKFELIRNGKTYEYELSDAKHQNIKLYPHDQISLQK